MEMQIYKTKSKGGGGQGGPWDRFWGGTDMKMPHS
jgi:hypothetical protein